MQLNYKNIYNAVSFLWLLKSLEKSTSKKLKKYLFLIILKTIFFTSIFALKTIAKFLNYLKKNKASLNHFWDILK